MKRQNEAGGMTPELAQNVQNLYRGNAAVPPARDDDRGCRGRLTFARC